MIYFKTREEARKYKKYRPIDLGKNPPMNRNNPKGLRWAIKTGF